MSVVAHGIKLVTEEIGCFQFWLAIGGEEVDPWRIPPCLPLGSGSLFSITSSYWFLSTKRTPFPPVHLYLQRYASLYAQIFTYTLVTPPPFKFSNWGSLQF